MYVPFPLLRFIYQNKVMNYMIFPYFVSLCSLFTFRPYFHLSSFISLSFLPFSRALIFRWYLFNSYHFCLFYFCCSMFISYVVSSLLCYTLFLSHRVYFHPFDCVIPCFISSPLPSFLMYSIWFVISFLIIKSNQFIL